jgi:hypothetical protein
VGEVKIASKGRRQVGILANNDQLVLRGYLAEEWKLTLP